MPLMELWVAVGEDYRFRRNLGSWQLEVCRHAGAWTYAVACEGALLGEGRASTWDEATSTALAHAEQLGCTLSTTEPNDAPPPSAWTA
jgi:hypothetical protein